MIDTCNAVPTSLVPLRPTRVLCSRRFLHVLHVLHGRPDPYGTDRQGVDGRREREDPHDGPHTPVGDRAGDGTSRSGYRIPEPPIARSLTRSLARLLVRYTSTRRRRISWSGTTCTVKRGTCCLCRSWRPSRRRSRRRTSFPCVIRCCCRMWMRGCGWMMLLRVWRLRRR